MPIPVVFDTYTYLEDDTMVSVTVEANVHVMPDPYGTGDSPTQYEVHDMRVFGQADGTDFTAHLIRGQETRLHDLAISQLTGA